MFYIQERLYNNKMSQICFGKVNGLTDKEKQQYFADIIVITQKYGYSIYPVNWNEPVIESFGNCFYFSLGDKTWGDCEKLFLPDGWHMGEYTNTVRFEERMKLLYDVACFFVVKCHCFEYYIGCSGDQNDDFKCYQIKLDNLVPLLSRTVGKTGDLCSIHIMISGSEGDTCSCQVLNTV